MSELIQALEQVQAQTGIDKEVIFQAIESSMLTACKKNFGTSENITVTMDRQSGDIRVIAQKNVVAEVADPALEISLIDAVKINSAFQIGDADAHGRVLLPRFRISREIKAAVLAERRVDREHRHFGVVEAVETDLL